MPRRPPYEPPVSRDLSELTVSGQVEPQGICEGGSAISGNVSCAFGRSPVGNPTYCSPVGSNAALGGCGVGSRAETDCYSGAVLS